jgi:hypothetical protein
VLRSARIPFIFATDFRNMQDPMFTGPPAMLQNLPFTKHGNASSQTLIPARPPAGFYIKRPAASPPGSVLFLPPAAP